MSKRRSSIMRTAPILGLRLEVEQVLQNLTTDPVLVEIFISAVKAQSSIVSGLKGITLDEIRSKYRNGKMPRSDCESILMNVTNPSAAGISEDPSNHVIDLDLADPSGHLIPQQSMVLNIETTLNLGTLHIGIMDQEDPRVTMSPENKLTVKSLENIEELVQAYAKSHNITGESNIGMVFDYAERAVLKACQKEIRLLDEAIEEFKCQSKTMAGLVMASEERMIAALKEREKQRFVYSVKSSGGSTAARRGSVMKDISRATAGQETANGGSSTSLSSSHPENTPARLALKLNELQQRCLEAEKELKHYLDLEENLQYDPNTPILPPPKDSNTTRTDWRIRVDSDLSRKKAENDRQSEQNRMLHNISVALRALCDGSGQNLVVQRDHIRLERQRKIERIAALQAELASANAEVNSLQDNSELINAANNT